MPEITFLEPIFLNIEGDIEADLLHKKRKLIKKEFLDNLKQTFYTPEILNLVHKQSKNNRLKAKIKTHLNNVTIEKTLTPEEIKFFQNNCFVKVSKWVVNSFKLKVLLKSNLEEAAQKMFEDKLFSSATFNRVYNRNICILLAIEKNPNKTQSEHRLFDKYEKILEIFKDKETLSPDEMSTILRKKLHYKLRDVSTAIILNEIGFVFDVTYDRKTKLYTLKKWDKFISSSIEKDKKKCTTQYTIDEEVKYSKEPFWLTLEEATKTAQNEEFTPEEIEKFEEELKQNTDEDLIEILENLEI